MANLSELHSAILNGDQKTAVAITQQGIDEGLDPVSLINGTMVPAMSEVGRLYEVGDYFVPELLVSARAMKGALALLRPLLASSGAQPVGRVVIGTVKGDFHDIGKNLVTSMLEGGGFEVTDLGVDVAPEKFVEVVHTQQPHIVCLSALLTVTMPSMKATIQALQSAGLRQKVKILVGGAPITPEFARDVGADGYGENASVAVRVAREICEAGQSA